MEEIWKDIEGYEGLYQVSNLGRVKSLPKEWVIGNGTVQKHNGKILKPSISNSGYCRVNLYLNRKYKHFLVHQLVAIEFLGHKPCGHDLVIDHIDDNKLNNRVDNLQIVTQRFNVCKTQGKYTSNYKGVYWYKPYCKWRSQIRIDGKKKHLGNFDSEEEAHEAYQKALKDLENKK